jgi:hypothetical protein
MTSMAELALLRQPSQLKASRLIFSVLEHLVAQDMHLVDGLVAA